MRVLLLAAAWAAVAPQGVVFEPKPRLVSPGREPVIAVRASGALSLLEVEGKDLFLKTSFDAGDSFETKVRVNDVPGEVAAHHESSPRMSVRSRSEFYILWQTRRDGEASALRFARSTNWGESFSKAGDVEPGNATASQGFYNMAVSPKGVVYVAWLDGRDRAKSKPGTSAVYLARSTNRGVSFDKPVRVTLDTCPCCRPSIAFTGDDNVHVAWRGVINDDIRDIFMATSADGGATFSKGVRVAEDNWKISGCPHSGAVLTSVQKRILATWSTVREGKAQLYAAWSDDNGRTFSARTRVADTVVDPNHPSVVSMGDRAAIVFQGRPSGKSAGWGQVNAYYREIDVAGKLSPLVRLGNAKASASYPELAYEEPGRVFVAWTEAAGDDDSHRVVLLRGRRE
ncbi:MAG: sialidase family protein [Bryobacteraceae bacterium]|nr:sialidase family protein [Bryobacteraceae bacterium]